MAAKIIRIIIVIMPCVAFELAVRLGFLDPFTFIPLSEMFINAGLMLFDKNFLINSVFPTIFEAMISFVSASLFGILIGILLWGSETLYDTLQPYLILSYAIPFFAIYPVFISLFGIGSIPVIIIGTLFAIPAVIMNTAIGFRETKRVLIKVGKSMVLTPRQMFFYIYLPAAWPYIFTGLKLGLAYSIISVIATEFILSTRGLGHNIAFTYNNFDLQGMYGSIILVVLIVLFINTVLSYFESALYNRNVKGR